MMIDTPEMERTATPLDRIDARIPPTVTADGHARLRERVDDLRNRRLPELANLMAEEERDERVVAEFEAMLLEIAEWEAFLAEAQLLTATPDADGRVALGARTLIALPDGAEEWVRPVHPREAFLDDERISVTSPLGSAIIGAQAGDVVRVEAPAGAWEATIRDIEGVDGQVRRRGRRGTSSPSGRKAAPRKRPR